MPAGLPGQVTEAWRPEEGDEGDEVHADVS
jgi:hypothetical protein